MNAEKLLSPELNRTRSDGAKSKLLESALVIFSQKGVEGATVREIAKAAGQNIAAISYYFGSKENLYHAVIDAAAGEILNRAGTLLAEVKQRRAAGKMLPAEALDLIKRLIRSVYMEIASREDSLAFGRLVVREQMQPTPAFDILYEKCFRHMHEGLTFLVSTVLGIDPGKPQAIIRAHTVLGQAFAFCIARATIRRRLGWTTLEGENGEMVAQIIEENIEALFLGLQQRPPSGSTKNGRRRVVKKLKTNL